MDERFDAMPDTVLRMQNYGGLRTPEWETCRSYHALPAPQGSEFEITKHDLDQSPETLQLAKEIRRWREEVRGRQLGDGNTAGVATEAKEAPPESNHHASERRAEDYLYVQIATALAEKLDSKEEDVSPFARPLCLQG